MGGGRSAHKATTVTEFVWRHAAVHRHRPATRCAIARAATSTLLLLLAVLGGAQTLEDLFARGTHRELLGITSRHPDLAAERHHRVTRHGTVHDLVLANIVREPLVVARLADLLLDLLALDHRGGCRGPSWLLSLIHISEP